MLAIFKGGDTKWLTKTCNYLINTININVGTFIDFGLKDAYLGDGEKPVNFPAIYLLFEPEFTDNFADFCEKIKKHPNYEFEYDLEGEVMFVFKIPEEFWNDVELFKQGKYSEISKSYVRKNFTKFDDPRYKVFNKDVYYRKKVEDYIGEPLSDTDELEGIPLPENEIYRYKGKGW